MRKSTYHRYIRNKALRQNPTKQMDLEDRIILALSTMTILEDIQRILSITRAPANVLDRVRDIGIHLVDNHVHVLVEEPLARVREAPGLERVVLGDHRPFWEDFRVDVRCTPGVVARVDA